jgi:hypothetical protein
VRKTKIRILKIFVITCGRNIMQFSIVPFVFLVVLIKHSSSNFTSFVRNPADDYICT